MSINRKTTNLGHSEIIATTTDALLVSTEIGTLWIPRSWVSRTFREGAIHRESEKGDFGDLVIPERFAKEKGLI